MKRDLILPADNTKTETKNKSKPETNTTNKPKLKQTCNNQFEIDQSILRHKKHDLETELNSTNKSKLINLEEHET